MKLIPFFFMDGTDKAQFSRAAPKATLPSFTFTCHLAAYSGSAICCKSKLNCAIIFMKRSCICSGVTFNSLINLSTLLINNTGLTLSLNACFKTVSVCGIIPSTAQTKTTVPSIALIALVTFPEKSTCPGVSIKLIKYSSPPNSWGIETFAASTVISLSCSSECCQVVIPSSKSPAFFAAIIPAAASNTSVKAVL